AVTCAVLVCATAVLEALALGLAGLGGSPAALTGGAVLTWLLTRRVTPDPAVSVERELLAWWALLPRGPRVAIGALAGALLPLSAVLMSAAGWLGLRRLEVAPLIRTLALAALVLGPLLIVALPQPGTDVPALTWLICCAALAATSRERPALLVPAILALGLAV